MASDLRIETTPYGKVVLPPEPHETVILYLHGNRTLTEEPEAATTFASDLAVRTGASVVCARHRPSFPEALDDVQRIYNHCRTMGPVMVAGQWLGAGLVASLLVRLRDDDADQPRCAVLMSALLDVSLEAQSLLFKAAADPSFDIDSFRQRVRAYAAGTPPTHPLLSPLHANLHGLPPIQLLSAGTDLVLDDSLAFAARAARSGVTVDLYVRPDTSALRDEAVAAMAAFIGGWNPATADRALPPLMR